jgi:CubicO group peptidase (beta-lactamase class C family)
MPFPADLDRTIMTRTFTQPRVDPRESMTKDWRAASLPAVNGHTHARSLATVASAMANEGRAGGRELIDESIVRRALTPQTSGRDLVLGTDITWGLGLAASAENNPAGLTPGPRWFWGGWGGSLVVIDPPRRLTFAYTMNRMSPGLVGSPRSRRYFRVLDHCLRHEKEGP